MSTRDKANKGDNSDPTNNANTTDNVHTTSNVGTTDNKTVSHIDHTGFPHVIDTILEHGSFSTLLIFRATSREFRDRINRDLQHLVMAERPGPLSGEPAVEIRTKKGYLLVSVPSSACVGECCPKERSDTSSAAWDKESETLSSVDDKQSDAHSSDEQSDTAPSDCEEQREPLSSPSTEPSYTDEQTEMLCEAERLVNYLPQKNDPKAVKNALPYNRSGKAALSALIIDIVGEFQPNSESAPHFASGFLMQIGEIKELRYLSARDSLSSTALVPETHDLVILNDWFAAPRSIKVLQTPVRPSSLDAFVVYHMGGVEAVTQHELFNTFAEYPTGNTVIYDFTYSKANFAPKYSNEILRQLNSCSSKSELAPIDQLVRHIARYIMRGHEIFIVGEPTPTWFDPDSWSSIPAPSIDIHSIAFEAPEGLRRFGELLDAEVKRSGVNHAELYYIGPSDRYWSCYSPPSYRSLAKYALPMVIGKKKRG